MWRRRRLDDLISSLVFPPDKSTRPTHTATQTTQSTEGDATSDKKARLSSITSSARGSHPLAEFVIKMDLMQAIRAMFAYALLRSGRLCAAWHGIRARADSLEPARHCV